MADAGRNALHPPSARLGSTNALLLGHGRRHVVREYPGPLSIKYVLEGRVAWKLGRREIPVDGQSFLVVHAGEPYSMDLDLPRPARTCCVFFADGFAERAAHALERPEVALLDEPDRAAAPLVFLSQLQRADQRIVPRLRRLAEAYARGMPDAMWLDQQYMMLAHGLVGLREQTRQQADRLPGVRPGTRTEALRRLGRGVEFLHAHAGERVTLRAVARAACLSEFHFHRLFVRAFGESPHAYLTRLRLDRARLRLASDAASVTEICAEASFESLGSFSALFRRRFGMSPSQVQRAGMR